MGPGVSVDGGVPGGVPLESKSPAQDLLHAMACRLTHSTGGGEAPELVNSAKFLWCKSPTINELLSSVEE